MLRTGGSNDLNDPCGRESCDEVMGVLVSRDGTAGALTELTSQIAESGVIVLFMGYREGPDDAESGFHRCGDELDEMRVRASAMANRSDGVFFIDMPDATTAKQREVDDDDRVHPSVDPSRPRRPPCRGTVRGRTVHSVR
jgi:hypothetical protein